MLNMQAAHTLASHLKAHGYSASVQGDQVTIDDAGRQVDASPRPEEYEDLRSADPVASCRAVNAALGRASLPPIASTVYRKVDARRAKLDENFEDILFRTKSLSRCPNPDNAELMRYAPLAKRAAVRVFSRFRLPLKAFGLETEDMETFAMVHLVTAIHRYKVGDDAQDEKVLGRYLKQRLMEIVRKVQRKSLQCSADTRQRNFADVSFFIDTGSTDRSN